MRKWLWLGCLLSVMLGSALLYYWTRQIHGISGPLVSLKYVRTVEPYGDDVQFFVSNHTTSALTILITTIEAHSGNSWSTYCTVPFPGALAFYRSEHQTLLAPREAIYGGILGRGGPQKQRALLPTNTAWRVRGTVQRKLTGGSAVVTKLANFPSRIRMRTSTGITNLSVNPFWNADGGWSVFGRKQEFVSDEFPPP